MPCCRSILSIGRYTGRYKVQDRYIALRWLRFASILTLWNGFCITIGQATWNPSARLILKNVRHWSEERSRKKLYFRVLSYKKGWTIEFFICPHEVMREWDFLFRKEFRCSLQTFRLLSVNILFFSAEHFFYESTLLNTCYWDWKL